MLLKEFVREQSKNYHRIEQPMIIITGDADKTVGPYIHSVPLHEATPNSELILLEDVGHMPHYVEKATIIDAIKRLADRSGWRENR